MLGTLAREQLEIDPKGLPARANLVDEGTVEPAPATAKATKTSPTMLRNVASYTAVGSESFLNVILRSPLALSNAARNLRAATARRLLLLAGVAGPTPAARTHLACPTAGPLQPLGC